MPVKYVKDNELFCPIAGLFTEYYKILQINNVRKGEVKYKSNLVTFEEANILHKFKENLNIIDGQKYREAKNFGPVITILIDISERILKQINLWRKDGNSMLEQVSLEWMRHFDRINELHDELAQSEVVEMKLVPVLNPIMYLS